MSFMKLSLNSYLSERLQLYVLNFITFVSVTMYILGKYFHSKIAITVYERLRISLKIFCVGFILVRFNPWLAYLGIDKGVHNRTYSPVDVEIIFSCGLFLLFTIVTDIIELIQREYKIAHEKVVTGVIGVQGIDITSASKPFNNVSDKM